MTTVYVPGDSGACSVGADEVAARLAASAVARGLDVQIVRTGSRGLMWLEPLIEVEAGGNRLGYGPVQETDIDGLLEALLEGGDHPLALGPVRDHEWLARQQRVTFARVGVIDPLDPRAFEEHGGLRGLRAAIALDGDTIIEHVLHSGLRGRGGAAFPAGIKWRTVRAEDADRRYVVCNADEGDSGTFADRMLIEGDPFTLIEGMAIAGLAVGAEHGYVYLRSEYPDAIEVLQRAIGIARDEGWLGTDVLGSGRAFDVQVRVGAGSYVCGEETAMLESLEGRRGTVRAKPPVPAVAGLFGRPTVIHNVLTLATVPMILADGADEYRSLGTERSRGTKVLQLSGNVARGGIVEVEFGVTLRELVEGYGGGTLSGRPVRAVQVGGPLGAYLPPDWMDLPLDYDVLAEAGAMLGHGGIVVFDDTVDMAQQARFAMEFCAEESCGKCTPCRIGARRGVEVMDRVIAGVDPARNLVLLEDLCTVMTDGSLCAMGGLTPLPVRSAMRHWPEDFGGES